MRLEGTVVVWKRIRGAYRAIAALRDCGIVVEREGLRSEGHGSRGYSVKGGATFVHRRLMWRGWLREGHVCKVWLSAGHESFMGILVITDHVQLADDVFL